MTPSPQNPQLGHDNQGAATSSLSPLPQLWYQQKQLCSKSAQVTDPNKLTLSKFPAGNIKLWARYASLNPSECQEWLLHPMPLHQIQDTCGSKRGGSRIIPGQRPWVRIKAMFLEAMKCQYSISTVPNKKPCSDFFFINCHKMMQCI